MQSGTTDARLKSTTLSVAVGDVHGMLDELDILLACISDWRRRASETAVRLIFLGDYIDRGPDSAGVIARVRALQSQGAVALRGNHEQMLIDALDSEDAMQLFLGNGGDATLHSLGSFEALVDAALWCESLPLTHEDDLRLFVHAGIRPGIPLANQRPRDLLWIRQQFSDAPGPHPKYIVHGHTPLLGDSTRERLPLILPHRSNLDTGAVYDGPLSAAVFTDHQAAPIATLSSERRLCQTRRNVEFETVSLGPGKR
jgi:serine/threonine protein phosphatase 1